MTGLWLVSYVLLWLLLLAVAVVLVSTLRNLGVVYSVISGSAGRAGASAPGQLPKPSTLKGGEKVPNATLTTATGDVRHAWDFAGSKMAFAIVSPSCGSCVNLLEHLNQGPDPLDESLRDFVVISLGDVEQTEQLMERANMATRAVVLFDRDHDIAQGWGIVTTPGTVIVDEECRLVRQIFGGHELMALRAGSGLEALPAT